MEGSCNYFLLLLLCELDEVNSIARNTDGQVWILLRVFHCVQERCTLKDIDINVVALLTEIPIEDSCEVAAALLIA